MSKQPVHTSDLVPDPRNANKGSERGRGMLEDSIRQLGLGRSIVLDKNGVIIAGNKTAEVAVELGLEDLQVVHSDGTKLIAVMRDDLDLETDPAARRLAVADNRVGEISLEWDAAELQALLDEDAKALEGLFTDAEVDTLMNVLQEPDEAESQTVPEQFMIMVECQNETTQGELLQRLTDEGYTCRSLIS